MSVDLALGHLCTCGLGAGALRSATFLTLPLL